MAATVKKSWHTEAEWFVYNGGAYRGEIRYLPATMQWRAHPWRVWGRIVGKVFDEMEDAIAFASTAR